MKRALCFSAILTILICTNAIAQNRVVVIPLNSSSPVYVAGTEITSLPATISSPGFYFITKDLTNAAESPGITITADNVTLDLMGFSLIGSGVSGANNHGVLIDAKSNVEIRNGTVSNFGNDGIVGYWGSGHRIFNIRSQGNSNGINLADTPICTVAWCTAMNNSGHGIYVGMSSLITNNISFQNGSDGIRGENSSVISNNTSYLNGLSGIVGNLGTIIKGNTVSSNEGTSAYGIYGGTGALITGNNVYKNANKGIQSSSGSSVTNNTVTGNTNEGILLSGNNYVDGNTVTSNGTNMSSCATCTFGTNHAP